MAPPSMPAAHHLGGQIAGVGVQLIAGKNIVDQLLPVVGRIPGLRAIALARWARRRAGVAEIAAQQLDDIVDQLLRLRLADIGQIIARDVGRIAERPAIGLAGARMNAGDDDLLAVAQEFDFLAGAAVGGDQVGGDLGEWIRRCETELRASEACRCAAGYSRALRTARVPDLRSRSRRAR